MFFFFFSLLLPVFLHNLCLILWEVVSPSFLDLLVLIRPIQESSDLGRSNRIGIIRKTRNLFKNLRFCRKRKNCSLQLTSILKHLTLTRLQAFTSRIVTFKILTQIPFPCGSPFFISFLLPSASLDSPVDENLFHQSRTCNGTSDFFPYPPNSLEW